MTIKLQQTSLQSAQDTLHKRYNVSSTLGRGRFAVVKKARHIVSGERVAVKIIDKTKLDSNSAERLYNEVEYLRLAKHASIVKLYEAIDTPENLYLILERADRGDLYDFIMDHSCVIEMTEENGLNDEEKDDNEIDSGNSKVERMQAGIGERLARRFFKQIAEALFVCHTNNIVHRDLKPENVVIFTENMIPDNQPAVNPEQKVPQKNNNSQQQPQLPNHLHVHVNKNIPSKNAAKTQKLLSSSSSFSKSHQSSSGPVYLRAKITDFGFSNKFNPENQLLATSCGSLAYSAPEILLGDEYIAPAVDVWSLGVLLYMLVCGSAPFNEANDSETLTCIMDCKFTIPGYVSHACQNLIRRMITLEATQRLSIDQILKHPWVTAEEKQENSQNSRFAKNLRFVTKSGDIIDDSMLISNSWQSPMKHEIYEVFDKVKKLMKTENGEIGSGDSNKNNKVEYDDVEQVLLDSRLDEFSATCNLLLVNVRRNNRKKLLQMSRPQSVNETCIKVSKSLEKSFTIARTSSPVPTFNQNEMLTDENNNTEDMEDIDNNQEPAPGCQKSIENTFDGMEEVCNLEPAFNSAPCTPARTKNTENDKQEGMDEFYYRDNLIDSDQILPSYCSSSFQSVHIPKISRSNSSSSVSSEFSIQSQHSEIPSHGQLSNNSIVETVNQLVPENCFTSLSGQHTNSTSSRNNSSNNLLAEKVDVIMNDTSGSQIKDKTSENAVNKHSSGRSSSVRSNSQAAAKRRLSGTTAVPQRESMTITPRKTVSENVKSILQKTLSSSSVSRDVQSHLTTGGLSVLEQDCEFNNSYNSTPKNYSPIPPKNNSNQEVPENTMEIENQEITSNSNSNMPPPSYVPIIAHSRNSSISSVSSVDHHFQINTINRPLSPLHNSHSKSSNPTSSALHHHQGTTLHQITENTRQTSEENEDNEDGTNSDKIAELIEENAINIPQPPPIRNYRRINHLRHLHIISSSENSDGSDNDSRRTSSTNLASMYNKIRKSAGKTKSAGKSNSFDHGKNLDHQIEQESVIGTRAPLASEISSPGSLNTQTPANSLGDIHENIPPPREYVNVDRLDGLHEVDQELEDEFINNSSFGSGGHSRSGTGGYGKIRSSTTSENTSKNSNHNKSNVNNNRSLSTSDLNATIRRRYNYSLSNQAVINYRARSAHSSFLRKNANTESFDKILSFKFSMRNKIEKIVIFKTFCIPSASPAVVDTLKPVRSSIVSQ